MSKNTTSFDVLPTEIASFLCSLLRQSDVSSLCLTRKSIYQLVRPILYRHPSIDTYSSLVLFSRTFSDATYMGRADGQWSSKACEDQTKYLDLTIDPTKNVGQPPPAVMISRTIHAILRRCPDLAIALCFSHCRCHQSPVSALGTETFPRVTKLVVYVGAYDPAVPYSQERHRTACFPSAKYWRPFVNGEAFPDCSDLEIRHHWATTPPLNASLDLQKPSETHPPDFPPFRSQPRFGFQQRTSRFSNRPGFASSGPRTSHSSYLPSTEFIGSTNGLKNFRNIVLESPPEINSLLLMQLLGNPNSVASNLTSLELRFCDLDHDTISKLLFHAPPNLKHFVLLLIDNQDTSFYTLPGNHYTGNMNTGNVEHLCPLIRDFSKNLVHLEFGASMLCRELFFDDSEMQALRINGTETRLGAECGVTDQHFGQLDGHAVRETIQACRKQKRTKFRNDRISDEAISAVKDQFNSKASSRSLFGGNHVSQATVRAQREAEAALDEEEETRSRLIEGSKIPWFRRIISYQGLCNPADTWAEMQIAADMEEKGIEWVLANKKTQLASQHSNGKPTIDIDIDEAFREKYRLD